MKILFASPYNILDMTSGAALATRELLEKVIPRGFSCQTVTASVFDGVQGLSLEEALRRRNLGDVASDSIGALPVMHVRDGEIRHTILRTGRSRRNALRAEEERGLLALVDRAIREVRPDLVLTYGGLKLERQIHQLAKGRGIPVVFYLQNGLYSRAETFSDVTMILVPSVFLQDFYARRLGVKSRVLYPIFSLEKCRIGRNSPRFVTFFNPEPAKGGTLFFMLARMAGNSLPEAKFLLVEGRWKQADLEKAGIRTSEYPNVTVVPYQPDVRIIYAITRVLLYPSFWVEAFGRMVVEAQLNGIPVLAARHGGIPEALNGSGFPLDVPERCRKRYGLVPTPGEVQPWLDQLHVLLADENALNEAETRARAAAARFRSERIVDEAVALLEEAARSRRG